MPGASRGTDGSNPVPSSEESIANLISAQRWGTAGAGERAEKLVESLETGLAEAPKPRRMFTEVAEGILRGVGRSANLASAP